MKIRALKTTTNLPRGCVAEVDDYTARELIAQGYAIEDVPLDEQEAVPKGADNDNSPLGQTGSRTGVDALQSLLQEVQAPETLIYGPHDTPPQTDGQLDSSLSTTDTSSAHGQTPSTPATSTGG